MRQVYSKGTFPDPKCCEGKNLKRETASESLAVGSLIRALKRDRSRKKDNCWVKLAGKRGTRKTTD
jgi:hypothetical protein